MIKPIKLPEVGKVAKVIQLYIDDLPVLRCGPQVSTNSEVVHATILEQVLTEYSLPFSEIRLVFGCGPALTGDRYRVVGMGLIVNFGDVSCLRGRSEDYQIGIDKEHLREVQLLKDRQEFVRSRA